jgi:hypothetical protein
MFRGTSVLGYGASLLDEGNTSEALTWRLLTYDDLIF